MKTKACVLRIILVLCLILLATSAFYGGILMILYPDGSGLQIPLSNLEMSPFASYFWPGIILFSCLGILPASAIYTLMVPRKRAFFIYRDRQPGWTLSLCSGMALIIWMDVQLVMIGYGSLIQAIFMALGVLITVLTLAPPVMAYYHRSNTSAK